LEFDFTSSEDVFGTIKTLDLVENGSNLSLTEKNKKQFVLSLCTAKMTKNIQSQCQAFIQGIEDVIPPEGFNLFTE
jgi:hypothetical protein